MEIITLREDYIKLGQALKAAALVEDGVEAKLVIKDGEAGAAPAIGVKLDSDGKYYWTLDGEFITEGGKKMPVTGDDGVTPVFKIENDTWYVSYDKEATWKECGPATGAAGDSFFSDVSTSEDGRWVYLTLADGETVLTLLTPDVTMRYVGWLWNKRMGDPKFRRID